MQKLYSRMSDIKKAIAHSEIDKSLLPDIKYMETCDYAERYLEGTIEKIILSKISKNYDINSPI